VGIDQESAIQELCNNKGTQFDPEVLDRFVRILRRDKPAVNEFYKAVMIKK
jgi:HD-GYP domain-containing protein (c-di-GMP phosphodiesterase class II)